MITAYTFMMLNILGWILALFKSPFWGLLVYANIYFNTPNEMLNWWAGYLPNIRWSLIASLILIVSILIHRTKISRRNFGNSWWSVVFLIYTILITFTWGVNNANAVEYINMLFAFCLACYFIIRCIKDEKDLRFFLLLIVIFATQLSIKGYLYGKRIHARLEYNGTSDAYGSNEFALLLAGIIPLVIPFLVKGKWYEKLVCVLSIPFLLNAFVLCNSRGAFVSLVISSLLVLSFFSDQKIRKMLFILMLCSIPAFLYLSDAEFINRLLTLKESNSVSLADPKTNNLSSGRIEIWKYGFKMANDHPFGAGPNSFKYLARSYMPPEVLSFHPGEASGVRAAHNTYLQILVEQGYLGLIFFMIMCLQALRMLRQALYKLKQQASMNGFLGYTVLALGLSFLSILIGGMFNSRFYYEFFWWQITLITVVCSYVIDIHGELHQNQTAPSP
jgi:putative inorganic carbon (hco3(-)) transporter